MNAPAPDSLLPGTSSTSKPGMQSSDWLFITWFIAIAASLLWVLNQVVHMVTVREGPQYVCARDAVPDRARALGASSQGIVSGRSTFFPPTFVCAYPAQADPQSMVYVDMYPTGPWIFWASLSVFALATVLAIVLRHRARRKHGGENH